MDEGGFAEVDCVEQEFAGVELSPCRSSDDVADDLATDCPGVVEVIADGRGGEAERA